MAVKTDPIESLRRVPIFSGLDKKELETLAKLVKEQQYAAGATIVKSGAGGHGFYILKGGPGSGGRGGAAGWPTGPRPVFRGNSLLGGGPKADPGGAGDGTGPPYLGSSGDK